MSTRHSARYASLLCGAATIAISAAAGTAYAQEAQFNISPQSLASALNAFSEQSDQAVIFRPDLATAKVSQGVTGSQDVKLALNQLLAGTGLTYHRDGDAFVIIQGGSGDPQSLSAGGDVDALIVTAQKREENIQDVPIAISAFSQEDLTTRQVAGGPDLITQIPNMTFTKTNFASYSIQIRGIGTQAISATTDAAVAVAFNNSSMIRNRFFEQEFYDLERVEVLRGPQGTLYGRNATAGVVNIITSKPKFRYEAKASADVANYNSTRVEGMVNVPLVEDMVALRLAGAWTKREGFVDNQITGNPIDGRDLWSTRATLRFEPTDAISANLIWEHFQEDDDRLRSGKQLCHRDDRQTIGGYTVPDLSGYGGLFSQGCMAASLYAPESFEAPNGFSLPYYHPLGAIFLPVIDGFDPYASTTQSRDLRVIESTVDPQYRAKSDVAELQLNIDLSDSLTLTSETTYSADTLFSTQDYNRFNTASGAFANLSNQIPRQGILTPGPNGNVFCDPQIGCADRLVAVDLSTAESRQFSQEFRLGSNFDGPFNFSVGGNFLRYDTEDKYYVFINTVSLYSTISMYPIGSSGFPGGINPDYVPNVSDNLECLIHGPVLPDPSVPQPITSCMYIDPNPIGSLNDQGHNYFLSRNPYKLVSYAAFGEAYYNITDNLKLTGGLRVTVDKKEAPRIPSWLLGGITVGTTVAEIVTQDWTEPTGRLALDWKPNDDTLLYASYAHGYKAGGANPPSAGVVAYANQVAAEALIAKSASHPKTFDPEFVDAFEVGAKNTLFDGALTLNAAAFFYDYKGYQISYIVDRSAVSLNFDAQIAGLEIEADWRPTDSLRLGFKGGYEKTRVADGSQAIDLMDRTAGKEGWIVVKPFPSFPSNCILPTYAFAGAGNVLTRAPNVYQGGNPGPCEEAYIQGLDPVTSLPYKLNPTVTRDNFSLATMFPNYKGYDPTVDVGQNNGEGFYKDLSGNELPNAPEFTGTLTADYTVPLAGDWLATLHGDLHYQGESWTRIFNTEGYDKLKAYTNINLALLLNNDEAGWRVMAYVKNVTDADSITGSFLNSDDSGLTTNVFLTEPRLYGIRVTKEWTGGELFGGLLEPREHAPGEPYRYTLEYGASADQFLSETETFRPAFLNDYQPSLVFPLGVQNQDLDRGDQRDVKLTYAPGGGWKVSAALRYGRVNGAGRAAAYEKLPDGIWTNPPPLTNVTAEGPTNYGVSNVQDTQHHDIVDFAVGKDIGMGAFGGGKSTIGAGLRYARFSETTAVTMYGTPDWFWPAVVPSKYRTDSHTTHKATLTTDRSFEGVGPVVSWDASSSLLGDDTRGRVDLEWSVSGGVLFGEQQVEARGHRKANFLHHPSTGFPFPPEVLTVQYDAPITISRTEDVTVPTLGLSLGVSYAIDRVKVSGGYRWERYFDAIDGGYLDAKSFDRGFDGPYLKLSLGFGG